MINLELIIYSLSEPTSKEVGWLHKINDVLVLSFYDNGEWKCISSNITEELINAETTNRTLADTALGIRIDAEANTRNSADIAISSALNIESSYRANADALLNSDIVAEKTRATTVENTISTSVGLDPLTKIYTNTGLYIGKLVVNTVTSDIKALDTLTKSNTDSITTLLTSIIEAKTEVKGQTDKIDVVSSTGTDGHIIYTVLLDPKFLATINGIPAQTNAIIDGQLNTGGTIDTAILNKASLFNTGLLGSLTVASTDPIPGKNGYYVYTDSGTNAHGTIDAGDTLLVTYDSSVYTYTLIKKYNNINIEYAKNNTGSTIGRGKLIYISGSTGENPLFLLATNTDYNSAARAWGMTYDGINAGAVGRVIHFGLIENLDTSAYTAGTELWLGVNGEFTNVRPTSPAIQTSIGMVIRQSATVGSIFVNMRYVNIEDVRNQNPNTAPSSKLFDDELTRVQSDLAKFNTFTDDETYSQVLLDSNQKILESRDAIGKKTIYTEVQCNESVSFEKGLEICELSSLEKDTSSEFVKAEIDQNQKLISALKPDGTYYFAKLDSPTLDAVISLIRKENPLYGKNMCIMGDSIIQVASNIGYDEYKGMFHYLDENTSTTYLPNSSDVEVIQGCAWLKSSLESGEVKENSIRLKVVLEPETKQVVGNMTMNQVKSGLELHELTVLGFGGSKFTENNLISDDISVGDLGEYDTAASRMGSFPNECRMLVRMVNEGLRETPDCVVVWLGTNGADRIITDTLDEAMRIPWTTLSDDYNGYPYRQKFYGAIRYGIEYLYRNFPYLNIIFVTPWQNRNGDYTSDGIHGDNYRGYTSLTNANNALKEIAARYSCRVIDGLTTMGISNFDWKAGANSEEADNPGIVINTFFGAGLHQRPAGNTLLYNFLNRFVKLNYYNKK